MFDRPYPWKKLSKQQLIGQPDTILHRYKFNDSCEDYIVDVHEKTNCLFLIEYYLRKDIKSNKEEKYGKLSPSAGIASKIIATCFDIMNKIYIDFECNASFAFVGVPIYLDGIPTEMENSKRYRVYRYAAINTFGPETFSHFSDPMTNSYLIANNKSDVKELITQTNSILKAYLSYDNFLYRSVSSPTEIVFAKHESTLNIFTSNFPAQEFFKIFFICRCPHRPKLLLLNTHLM